MNVCALLSLSVLSAKAQTTYMEMEQLTVNDQVTTVITASEPIRFVDISTDKVVGRPTHQQHHPPEAEGQRVCRR